MAGARARQIAGSNRRARVLRKASDLFTINGLHGTATLTLAQAAGISEADLLQVRFGNKAELFREVVEINVEMCLHSLDRELASIAGETEIDSVEGMAEATMLICLSDARNPMLMNWALEAPEFAADLYRNEIGSVGVLWDREVLRRFPASRA
jgi:AcrR family transcriptional regulator